MPVREDKGDKQSQWSTGKAESSRLERKKAPMKEATGENSTASPNTELAFTLNQFRPLCARATCRAREDQGRHKSNWKVKRMRLGKSNFQLVFMNRGDAFVGSAINKCTTYFGNKPNTPRG